MAVSSKTATGDRKQCDLCRAECAKYKCPLCPVEFCSSRCYKDHRDKHDAEVIKPKSPTPPPRTPEHPRSYTQTEQEKVVSAAKPKKTAPCTVCGQELAKYQCPRCPKKFCSTGCSAIHREKHAAQTHSPAKPMYSGEKPLTRKRKTEQQLHPFSVLDNAPELRQLFAKRPNLAAKLDAIYETTLPPKDQPAGSGGSGGSGLPWKVPAMDQRGRKKGEDQQPWTQDVGLRRGQKALRDARVHPSDGPAVREFCELIMHLLSKESGDGGPPTATLIVQKQVTDQELQMIKNLLEKDEGMFR